MVFTLWSAGMPEATEFYSAQTWNLLFSQNLIPHFPSVPTYKPHFIALLKDSSLTHGLYTDHLKNWFHRFDPWWPSQD